jgi:uncharacterized protein with GYD domain
VQTGKLSTGVAEELLLIRDPETRKEFAARAVAEQWSQDHARGQTRALRLDRQRAHLGKLARELVDILATLGPLDIPIEAQRDLFVLRGRIDVLSGRGVRMPTIEAAERAAGVTAKVKERAEARRRMKPRHKSRAS